MESQPFYTSQATRERVQAIIGVAAFFMVVSWATLSLRSWIRAFMLHNFGWDDGAMVVAAMVFTLYLGFTLATVKLANDGRITQLTLAELSRLMSYLLGSLSLYIATMVFFKIALALFYLRVVVRPWQRYVVYGAIALSTFFGTSYFFVVIFMCGNPANFLQGQIEGTCIDDEVLFRINMTAGIINAGTDWCLALLPIFVLRRSNMPRSAKISASLVLLLGATGSIVSIVRLRYIRGLTSGSHFFGNAVDITIWSIVEAGLGIAAACLATCRPLFKCMAERARTPFAGSSNTPSRDRKSPGPGNSDHSWHSRSSARGKTPADQQERTSYRLEPVDLASRPKSGARSSRAWQRIEQPPVEGSLGGPREAPVRDRPIMTVATPISAFRRPQQKSLPPSPALSPVSSPRSGRRRSLLDWEARLKGDVKEIEELGRCVTPDAGRVA